MLIGRSTESFPKNGCAVRFLLGMAMLRGFPGGVSTVFPVLPRLRFTLHPHIYLPQVPNLRLRINVPCGETIPSSCLRISSAGYIYDQCVRSEFARFRKGF